MDDYPGDARINAIAFTIGNYGYVGTGQSKDDKQTKDFIVSTRQPLQVASGAL